MSAPALSKKTPPGAAKKRGFALALYVAAALGAIVAALAIPLSAYSLNLLMQAATYAIAVLGLTIVLGYTGQINLAQAAFFGLGAYSVALGTTAFALPFGLALVIGVVIAAIAGAMLGGLAGILVAPVLFVTVGMGSSIALKAFAASIIGGFGDVTGAIVGGLALGVIETFGAAYVSVPYKDAFAFLVLFGFLLVRPQGIFGERISEKA